MFGSGNMLVWYPVYRSLEEFGWLLKKIQSFTDGIQIWQAVTWNFGTW